MKTRSAFSSFHGSLVFSIPALLGLAAAPSALYADVPVPATAVPDPLAQAIASAKDPSSAIQAYVAASAAEPGNVSVEDVYLHRMVQFGLPEMADAQATNLTQRDPQDGVAWAVAGYMNAKRGQMDGAVADMQSAVRLAPQDAFVLRTASQMMAWYDLRADKAQMPAQTQASFEALGQALAGKPGYAEAYGAASGQLLQGATASAPEESAATTPSAAWAPPPAVAPMAAPMVAPTVPAYTYYPDYTYYPTYTPFADSYYYAPYWDNSFWWPSYGVIFDDDEFGYYHHDGDRNDHRDWNGGGTWENRGGVRDNRGGAWANQGGNWTNRNTRVNPAPTAGLGRTTTPVRTSRSPSFSYRPAPSMPVTNRAPAVSAPRVSAPRMSAPRLSAPSLNLGGGSHMGGLRMGGGGAVGGGFHGGGGGGGGRHR